MTGNLTLKSHVDDEFNCKSHEGDIYCSHTRNKSGVCTQCDCPLDNNPLEDGSMGEDGKPSDWE